MQPGNAVSSPQNATNLELQNTSVLYNMYCTYIQLYSICECGKSAKRSSEITVPLLSLQQVT